MNFYKALRLIALRDVLKEPPDYHIRHIQRWFSKTFHVPLPQVNELPFEDVLQAFYETKYEDMEEDQREEERQLLLETDEQRNARVAREEMEAASNLEFERQTDALAEKQQMEEAARPEDQKPLVPYELPNISRLPEPTLDPPVSIGQRLPPNIVMKFADPDDFARRLEEDDPREGNMPLKPPKVPTP